MSVYIKGFPLPNNCGACPLRLAWCRERIYMVTRPERCPLVYVPEHGDLIDIEKPQTNGDRIRSMSDYDLADWIAQILMYHGSFSRRPLTIDDNECPHECPLYKCCNDQPSDNIEDWLKSPVEVDDGT